MSEIPKGWRMVPTEPTEAMIQAVWKATLGGSLLSAERAARAMLAAAPAPEIDICPKCDGSGVGVADTICSRCGGLGGVLSCSPRHGREEPVKWLERWYGSDPQKGSAIVDERGNLIAYFGGDKATHKATTAAVAAHNATLATTPARNTSQIGEG